MSQRTTRGVGLAKSMVALPRLAEVLRRINLQQKVNRVMTHVQDYPTPYYVPSTQRERPETEDVPAPAHESLWHYASPPAPARDAEFTERIRTLTAPEAVVTLEDVFNTKMFVGHKATGTHWAMKRFVYGDCLGYHYMDATECLARLRKAMRIAQTIGLNNGTVLFLARQKHVRALMTKFANEVEMPYIWKGWPDGLLTNHQSWQHRVNNQLRAIVKGETVGRRRLLNSLGLANMRTKPDLLVFLDVETYRDAIEEAIKAEVPTMGICDTDIDPRGLTWIMPCNDDSIESIGLFLSTFCMGLREGLDAAAGVRDSCDTPLKTEPYLWDNDDRRQGNFHDMFLPNEKSTDSYVDDVGKERHMTEGETPRSLIEFRSSRISNESTFKRIANTVIRRDSKRSSDSPNYVQRFRQQLRSMAGRKSTRVIPLDDNEEPGAVDEVGLTSFKQLYDNAVSHCDIGERDMSADDVLKQLRLEIVSQEFASTHVDENAVGGDEIAQEGTEESDEAGDEVQEVDDTNAEDDVTNDPLLKRHAILVQLRDSNSSSMNKVMDEDFKRAAEFSSVFGEPDPETHEYAIPAQFRDRLGSKPRTFDDIIEALNEPYQALVEKQRRIERARKAQLDILVVEEGVAQDLLFYKH